jgi:hypothetical protein
MKSINYFTNTLVWFYSLTTFVDRIIIVLALVLLIGLYWHYWRIPTTAGSHAIIFNHHSQSVSLHQPQILKIQGRQGVSLLEVKAGKIRFIASPCQQKQCIHAGWLKTEGDFVACLPNQVSVEIRAQKTQEWDAIAY